MNAVLKSPLPMPQIGSPATSKRFYRPELDGLRFFAFLTVFIGHSCRINPLRVPVDNWLEREYWSWLWCIPQSGNIAVDLFFVLSSYLITELLLREHERTGRIDVPAFYLRRSLRIWPLYFAFLGIMLLAEAPLGIASGLTAHEIPWFATFLGNWSIVTSGRIPHSATQLLWTVSIEEQFYLAWPLLLWLVKPKRIAWLSLGLLAIGHVSRALLAAQDASYTAINFNTLTRLDGIAWGSLIAIGLRTYPLQLRPAGRQALLLAGIGLALATQRFFAPSSPAPVRILVAYPMFAAAAALILLGSLRPAGESGGLLTHPFSVFLGRISYGLYVWHMFAIVLVERLPGIRPGHWQTMLVSFPLTLALASVSYFALERPFLQLKQRFARVPSRDDGSSEAANRSAAAQPS